MKGVRELVLSLCVLLPFFASTALPQTNTPARAGRRYDSRVQMHTPPVTVQVPDDSFEAQKGAPESSEFEESFPTSIPEEQPQVRPNGPRLKAQPQKQQNKNWILPSSTDSGKEDANSSPDLQEEPVSSGWGWLADDVRARQQKEKEAENENDSKEKDNEFQPPSALQKEAVKPKTSGIFLDTSFKPVSTSLPTNEKKKSGAEEASVQDPGREEQKNREDGPTTAESPRNRTSADQPRDQKTGADATWGNERLWNKSEKAVTALPQTEALLSTSRFDARKPIEALDHPGFKPDVGSRAADRIQPNSSEPAPRNLVTATSFQPLPAAPVAELGTAPWNADLPGKTPFAGSTPIFPESRMAPSQPLESLKAPELPKPVATPWLK